MPVPVIAVSQMRTWENSSWAAGRSETGVIAQVGKIIARRILSFTSPNDGILILAGKGHNGDDARAAAPLLNERKVALLNVTDPAAALTELKSLLQSTPSLIVDGLFGIGINRPLSTAWQEFISAVNQSGARILAVDVPSGLNAETGEPEGAAIQAGLTLTVGAPKSGLLVPAAIPYVGRLEVAPEIGLISCPFTEDLNWTLPDDFAGFPPRRGVLSHKGTYGHAVILAGSAGYHGAAVLAARGAMRARPGLVSVVTESRAYAPVAAQLQAAMVHTFHHGENLPESTTAILAGPGLAARDLAPEWKSFIAWLWHESSLPVVADASALDFLPAGENPHAGLRIITPHPGEAARMLGSTTGEVQSNRLASLRALSHKFGDCWVILKGHQTVIGHSSGRAFINPSGNPGLAQGGSGDLLAGYLTGLLAQPVLRQEFETALRFGVWQHGASADLLERNRPNWTIEDLAAMIGCACSADFSLNVAA